MIFKHNTKRFRKSSEKTNCTTKQVQWRMWKSEIQAQIFVSTQNSWRLL